MGSLILVVSICMGKSIRIPRVKFINRVLMLKSIRNLLNAEEKGHNLNEAFHQGIPYLPRQNWLPQKEIQFYLEIITCDPTIYEMNHPKFIVSNQSLKRFNKIGLDVNDIWAATWDFQQFGMCDQQRLRPACAYAQSDKSLCSSLEYSRSVKLLT